MSRLRVLPAIRAVAVMTALTATAAGCGAAARSGEQPPPAAAPAAAGASAPVESGAAEPQPVTVAAPVTQVAKAPPAAPVSSLVATAAHGVTVYRRPDGRVLRQLSARTDLGAVRTLLVTDDNSNGWLQVLLPVRPNGTKGWIRRDAVGVTVTAMRVEINRARHTLVVWVADKRVARYTVAVGTASTPTPAGLFYITDRLPTLDPYGPYGPYAFGLSGYSDVLTSFDGADGVLGIHGTSADWSVGKAASHGCIRLHNRDIQALYKQVPLGTPVIVV